MANIHPTATIEEGAELGEGVEIGPNVIVRSRVRIGNNVRVSAGAILEGNTTIGSNCSIGYYSVIGGPPQDLKYKGEDTKLVIGDNTVIREYVTMNTGTIQAEGITKIGANCLFMAYCHVGHDCEVGDNVIVANSTNLAGHVILEDYVTITGGVGISQFNRVGKHAYIGGHSAIDRSVAPYCIGYGNRLIIKGVNLIGLKRRGYSADQVRAINDAHKIYFDGGKEKAQALKEIDELYPDQPDVRYFVDFIRNCKNGIAQ